MKRILDWKTTLGIILILLSATVYLIHYLIFRDARHIFIYLIGDIAFVFIEVLLVTLILNRLLAYRDKKVILKKLNMVIGSFFVEAGTELLKMCYDFDCGVSKITKHLLVTKEWTNKDFSYTLKQVREHVSDIDIKPDQLNKLKAYLVTKRQFFLNLLGNPNLLEHESFSDLLWAVFHLTDELSHRDDFNNLPATDIEHLIGDIRRVYSLLALEWLIYMRHLKNDYPYLFSLAIRTNPFDLSASVEIQK